MTQDSKRQKVYGFLKNLGKNIMEPETPPKASVDGATAALNSMSLGGAPAFPQPQPTTQSSGTQPEFIGGFTIPTNDSHHAPPPPPKRPSHTPYAMQTPTSNEPMSNTMQMAHEMLKDDQKDPYSPVYNLLGVPSKNQSRPVSTSNLPAQRPDFPIGTSATPPRVDTKPGHRRANSTPPATPTKDKKSDGAKQKKSSGSADAVQCSGVTKAGKRCTRQVKGVSSDDDDDEERFCYQHTNELLGPSGYYARKNGVWVEFADYIPDYLEPATKVALRVEMERAKSSSDVPGYIYTFEIRPDAANANRADTVQLKVGRAVNLVKRIDQWGKQCGSKEQVLRGWYPGTVDPDADDDSGDVSLMKGRVIAGPKGAWCHRLERLIHLELGDLARNRLYLEPNFPKGVQPPSSPANSSKTIPASTACPDCGQMHKEIFTFDRVPKGKLKGKEWEGIVKPVIEKWGAFVEAYV